MIFTCHISLKFIINTSATKQQTTIVEKSLGNKKLLRLYCRCQHDGFKMFIAVILMYGKALFEKAVSLSCFSCNELFKKLFTK